MGSQVKALCSCGIDKSIRIGGGRLNFEHLEYFPCFCKECKDLVEGNLRTTLLKCPNCGSLKITLYNNIALIDKIGGKVIERSFDNVLYDSNYFCPKCNKMSLKFHSGNIIWD